MNLGELATAAEKLARAEIVKFNVPEMLHFDISMEKGVWLAEELGANTEVVRLGVACMDLKLGQAFHEKRIAEHISMSVESAREFMSNCGLDDKSVMENVINCVEAHHGTVPFRTIEAEVCANADCYRFMHPKGIFFYFTVLGRRLGDFSAAAKQVEDKMDEKRAILSLPLAEKELLPIYENMKRYFRMARA